MKYRVLNLAVLGILMSLPVVASAQSIQFSTAEKMTSLWSPNEPLIFMHHDFIEDLQIEWQARNGRLTDMSQPNETWSPQKWNIE